MEDELLAKLRKNLLEAILEGEKDRACSIIAQYAKEYSYTDSLQALIEPCLEDFGNDWGNGERVSLGQGYILSKVVEDTYNHIVEERKRNNVTHNLKGPVVIGNILDDCHSLGRKLVITFLKLDGWEVIDLGDDIPPKDFVDVAVEHNAPIIAISAMMLKNALNIKLVREEINRRGLKDKIRLAVGGAIFTQRRNLYKEVGGDGSTMNAIQVPEMLDRFMKELKGD